MFPLLEWQQILLQLPEGRSGHITDGCCACGHHYEDPGLDHVFRSRGRYEGSDGRKSLGIENDLKGLKPWNRSNDANVWGTEARERERERCKHCLWVCFCGRPWTDFCLYCMCVCGLSYICVWQYVWAFETQSVRSHHQRRPPQTVRQQTLIDPGAAQQTEATTKRINTPIEREREVPEMYSSLPFFFLSLSVFSQLKRWIPLHNALKLNSCLLCHANMGKHFIKSLPLHHACNSTCQLCSVGQRLTAFFPAAAFSFIVCLFFFFSCHYVKKNVRDGIFCMRAANENLTFSLFTVLFPGSLWTSRSKNVPDPCTSRSIRARTNGNKV